MGPALFRQVEDPLAGRAADDGLATLQPGEVVYGELRVATLTVLRFGGADREVVADFEQDSEIVNRVSGWANLARIQDEM